MKHSRADRIRCLGPGCRRSCREAIFSRPNGSRWGVCSKRCERLYNEGDQAPAPEGAAA